MSNIEKIRQEIERRRLYYGKRMLQPDGMVARAKFDELTGFLAFIDSLPEETCKDSLQVQETCKENQDSFTSLEEAAKEYEFSCYQRACFHPEHKWPSTTKDVFIAVAEWQREQMELDGIVTLTESDFDAEKEKASEWGYNLCKKQMMNGAVEVDVADLNGEIYNNCIEKGMTDEDKVKIIIIKDND